MVADVDCTEEQDLCSDYDVKGYPTIKYWKAGESPDKGTDYQGGRTFDDLKKFVEDELEVKCLLSDPSGCTDKEVRSQSARPALTQASNAGARAPPLPGPASSWRARMPSPTLRVPCRRAAVAPD